MKYKLCQTTNYKSIFNVDERYLIFTEDGRICRIETYLYNKDLEDLLKDFLNYKIYFEVWDGEFEYIELGVFQKDSIHYDLAEYLI